MDSIILFPPGASGAGSQLQLGTYLMADPGANYGAQGLLQSLRSANALSDGGRFGFRYAPVRQMAIPLLLRDVPGQTLLQTESLMRQWSTPGAYVALQPETVPSGEAVFFDVIDGRWEPDYNTFENRVGRRKGTLFLDTQPFGYWPTELMLASAASVGYMGQLTVSGASVIGDVAPLAHIVFNPTIASQFAAAVGSGYPPDMLAFSLAARPSFRPFIGASSFPPSQPVFNTNATPSLGVPDKYSPASIAKIFTNTGSFAAANWFLAAETASFISSAIEPAYRGRFRVFAFAKAFPSTMPWQLMVDADRFVPSPPTTDLYSPQALASGNQLATAYSVARDAGGNSLSASPAYSVLDMGEITLPPSASGVQGGVRLRIWANQPSPFVGTAQIALGGLYLLPVDGAAGILTKGLYTPTLNSGVPGLLELNNGLSFDSVSITAPVPGGGSGRVAQDGRAFYRGVSPRLGASVQQLNFITADRRVTLSGADGGTYPTFAANVEWSQVSVSYRPAFSFLHGI